MTVTVVLGSQWGDEGKGKVIDYLAPNYNVVVRYNGGANAGHTVVVDQKKYDFHILPSSILYPEKASVISNGVLVDLDGLIKEINFVTNLSEDKKLLNLKISDRAFIVLDLHKKIDAIQEEQLILAAKKAAGESGSDDSMDNIGTTRKGIGPCMQDKVARIGLRICDLYQKDTLKEKIYRLLSNKEHMNLGVDVDELYDELLQKGEIIKPYVTDTFVFLNNEYNANKNILFEGAQGCMLDLDFGSFPFVTSSSITSAQACIGSGISFKKLTNAVGVCKAYTTRVGNGPFVSEIPEDDKMGDFLREKGGEYGVTTGRPRRCGWFDAVIVRHSIIQNEISEIFLTKLDVLSGFEKLPICVGYKKKNSSDGKVFSNYSECIDLAECEPVYEYMDGFDEDITSAKSFDELPENARKYVERIEELLGARISNIGVGADRRAVIER